jgi:hypothetical protein
MCPITRSSRRSWFTGTYTIARDSRHIPPQTHDSCSPEGRNAEKSGLAQLARTRAASLLRASSFDRPKEKHHRNPQILTSPTETQPTKVSSDLLHEQIRLRAFELYENARAKGRPRRGSGRQALQRNGCHLAATGANSAQSSCSSTQYGAYGGGGKDVVFSGSKGCNFLAKHLTAGPICFR